MKTQPIDRVSIMPTPVQPVMPTVGMKTMKKLQPSQKPSRDDALRSAKANITRRNSLRKQREELKS